MKQSEARTASASKGGVANCAFVLLALASLAHADGFDTVLVNLPEEGRYYALAGCSTQFTSQPPWHQVKSK